MNKSCSSLLLSIEPFLRNYVDCENLVVTEKNANELLTWNRFDLTFKIFYLEQLNLNVEFSEGLYELHLKSFGMGRIREPGNQNKNSIEVFTREFKKLHKSILNNGFDHKISLIPLANDGTIANGSHRIASSIVAKENVHCISTGVEMHNYDYNYFKKRNIPIAVLDQMACKFLEYSKNTFLAFIWPSVGNQEFLVEKYIRNIVYKKSINLNLNGAHNLLTQVYAGENWIGSFENNFEGVRGKLNECFRINNPLKIIAFQAVDLDEVLSIKEKIRKNFNLGKHSIHITDSSEESLNLGRVVFNDNSVHFLNNANPTRYKNNLTKLNLIKDIFKNFKVDKSSFIFDGGIVLSLYGLRESNDIDYLTIGNEVDLNAECKLFENHCDQLFFHKESAKELISNPKYYFYYEGIKFICLEQIYKMKLERGEGKDRIDCQLIQSVTKKSHFRLVNLFIIQSLIYFRLKAFYFIYKCIKTVGLLNIAKKILRRE